MEAPIPTTTYEATRARESNLRRPDLIHWQRNAAYRDQNYRHLDHQRGVIGHFDVHLLEACDLRRSHWSALALGPVRLLGLSKAHGAVSSFCTLSLGYEQRPVQPAVDSKPRARISLPSNINEPERFVSPIVPEDDNPVWNNCSFKIPFHKGVLQDGQKLRLDIRVDEDSTAVENIIPGVSPGNDGRMLGSGSLDLTTLCLGSNPRTGQPQVNVLDTWIPIQIKHGDMDDDDENDKDVLSEQSSLRKSLERSASKDRKQKADAQKDSNSSSNNNDGNSITGRVRVLVTYKPFGMEPRQHDIVALEAFARRTPSTMSCAPILSPHTPLRVREVCGPWLLLEHSQQACLRMHRNTVFVIERKNLVDETINLALLPADVFLSTPIGQTTWQVARPMVVAGRQLLMPALLSAKLFWMAARTTMLASFTGVTAASTAMWNEGSTQLTTDEYDDAPPAAASNLQIVPAASAVAPNYKFISL